ncbi:MAG: hypothetical protein JNM42_11555 [Propionivibrio sp.]|uniref:hypothetical protein n=1 Tax=Propionivibrio sp. TaxID=2212460 RepID=UPI001A456FBD|nr:hypothetical protein [Propionivibrio sp.]MBL8415062.1 hypothetical protein [Propionivibrio sp.]
MSTQRMLLPVLFVALKDKAEFDYLNSLPTSFVLPAEAVDRLRAAAGEIIMNSPDFQRVLKEGGARLASEAPTIDSTTAPVSGGLPMTLPAAR